MAVKGAVMVPHPPIIIPEIGCGEEVKARKTSDSYRKAAEKIAEWRPDTVIVVSPHSVMYADYFHISPGTGAKGDFGQFRAPQVKFRVDYDTEFVKVLVQEAEARDIPAGTLGEREKRLDHGTMVPLYFLDQYIQDYRIVRIGLSGMPLTVHYELGECIRKTAELLDREVVIIGSGDLSHKLKEDGPYGFQKEGPEYDERIMDVMGRGAFGELFDFSEDFCDKAAECGHRSFTIMAGALDGLKVKAERLSHQGTFGVGYGICTYEVTGNDPQRYFLEQYRREQREAAERRKGSEDVYVQLARETVETYVRTGTKIRVSEGLPEEMYSRRAGVFVSLKEEGRLRGCIGTITPVRRNVAEEIIENGISAAARDPRFHAVEPEELDRLEYSVDVLGETEEIDSPEELDVKRYGVVVSRGYRRGLILPDLEGVDTVEEQIEIARRKAGIPEDAEDIRLERFEVVRHF
ncbi:AmmeMemoRadiSam system protein A [Mediterraneibacter glycyrrhizinilyticus]|uniref:AmmeMemoRadiSam system protein A n=1 Tax=Mediterraneibacter glycyrrhizinilyticus TaxID=342942 RepID=UPI00196131CA|nr:AmmeMemoRadiSam system protein A [Mediterraneibacter glycyrrhizinilyticus]MBM6752167.1 AmmeMemoRadiSam system protein A [Mediterraneibacter glycyrrhizinilyticus]